MIDAADMRVPVLAGDASLAGADDMVQDVPVPRSATTHLPGCACCRPRPALAAALASLFIRRARAEIPYFARVIVPCAPAEEAALAASLLADPVTAARFRFAGRLSPQAGSVASPSPSGRCI
jgi:hypothetical protein